MTASSTGRRKKIAVFAPHYAEYAVRLALALAEHAEILLITETRNLANECRSFLLDEARLRLKLVTYDAHSRPGRLLAQLRIPLIMASFRPDLVHVQEQPDKTTARIVRSLRPFLPLLLTVHDPNPHTGRDAAYAGRQDGHRRYLRSAAAAFHVHGEYCQRELAKLVGTDRPIVSTPHGVILTPEPQETRAPEIGRILLFGRLEAYKGLEVLLEAADELTRRGVDHRIVVAGRGPELDRLRPRLARRGSIELVEKFLTPAEATDQFQRAHIVAAPYLNATQSGVVAAAFGNGRAIVASATGGLVDAVRDGSNGLLLDPGRADILAEALATLIQDPDLASRLAAGARAEAAGRLAWTTIAGTLLAAYSALIGSSKPART